VAFWGASALRRLAGRARTVMSALATDVVVTIRFLSRISLKIERHNSSVNGTQGRGRCGIISWRAMYSIDER